MKIKEIQLNHIHNTKDDDIKTDVHHAPKLCAVRDVQLDGQITIEEYINQLTGGNHE